MQPRCEAGSQIYLLGGFQLLARKPGLLVEGEHSVPDQNRVAEWKPGMNPETEREAVTRAADAAVRAADCALATEREAGKALGAIEYRVREVGHAAEVMAEESRAATEHAAGVYDAAIEISRQAHHAARNAELAAECAAEALEQTEEMANRVAEALDRLEAADGGPRIERIGASLEETIGPVPQWSASVPKPGRNVRRTAPAGTPAAVPVSASASIPAEAPLIASAGDEVSGRFAKKADHVVEVLRELEMRALSVEVSATPEDSQQPQSS